MFKKKIYIITLFLLLTFTNAYASHDHRTSIIQKILPAVVEVLAERSNTPSMQPRKPSQDPNGFQFRNKKERGLNERRKGGEKDAFHSGTGFVISSDGYVLTNAHVVNNVKQGGKITLRFYDDKKHGAKLINLDEESDIALLKIIPKTTGISVPDKFIFVEWGERPELGQNTIAIGSPLNLSFSITRGIVSALDRFVPELPSYVPFIQTDAAINPGNSGGPLFDENGKVIGINTLIMTGSGIKTGQAGSIGLGFAVDGVYAQGVVEQLMTGEKIERPYMGILYRSVLETDVDVQYYKSGVGVTIQEIVPNSPAFNIIFEGDVLLKINGSDIKWKMLATIIKNKKIGESIMFDIIRNGKSMKLEFKLGKKK